MIVAVVVAVYISAARRTIEAVRKLRSPFSCVVPELPNIYVFVCMSPETIMVTGRAGNFPLKVAEVGPVEFK